MVNSIIIATYNKAIWLELELNSILGAEENESFEIVIVNDGSIDNTEEVVKKFEKDLNIKYIYQKHKGLSAARNTAIKASKGDILVFVDDDRVINKKFLVEHINSHKQNNGDKLVVLGDKYQLFISNLEYKKDMIIEDIKNNYKFCKKMCREDDYFKIVKEMFRQEQNKYLILWIACSFANTSIKRAAFKNVGYFDENFYGWGCEDLELAYRLYENGYKFIFNENAVNYHIEHQRYSSIPEEFIRNYEYMYKKHKSLSMKLFLEFEQGRMSLQDYDNSIKNSEVIITNSHKNSYFRDKNTFRVNGM